jgi:hypothetical protein
MDNNGPFQGNGPFGLMAPFRGMALEGMANTGPFQGNGPFGRMAPFRGMALEGMGIFLSPEEWHSTNYQRNHIQPPITGGMVIGPSNFSFKERIGKLRRISKKGSVS